MKENCGDLEALKELGKNKKNPFTTEQLLDGNLKNIGGESRIEVSKRVKTAFYEILKKYKEKNIAIVSHGATLKFLLMDFCVLNENYQLEFNGQKISLNSPGVIKLTFDDDKLENLVQIV